jgi:hypothetical protein
MPDDTVNQALAALEARGFTSPYVRSFRDLGARKITGEDLARAADEPEASE